MTQHNINKEQTTALLEILENRFKAHPQRHEGIKWDEVYQAIIKNEVALNALYRMEESEGEPDVIGVDDNQSFLFFDCCKETPKGRRNCCYDQKAKDERKKFPPETDALSLANEMGVEILNELDYRLLQKLNPCDLKSSSWIHTPDSIRKKGGALFADCRYDTVFVYHNGADSYYSSRAFRAKLSVKR